MESNTDRNHGPIGCLNHFTALALAIHSNDVLYCVYFIWITNITNLSFWTVFTDKGTNFVFISTSKSLYHRTIFDRDEGWHRFNLIS